MQILLKIKRFDIEACRFLTNERNALMTGRLRRHCCIMDIVVFRQAVPIGERQLKTTISSDADTWFDARLHQRK